MTGAVRKDPAGQPVEPGRVHRPAQTRSAEVGRATASHGGARAPRRRVEQGRGDDGEVRRRGGGRAGRDVHRRRARQRAQPQAGPARRAGPTSARSGAPRWTPRGRSSASTRPGWASSTRACPRATRCRRCPRAASPCRTSRSPPARWCELMREFRPHVVTTYDEEGGYPHPDHIMCHKVSVAAFEAAGDPERYPELGEPWQPLKLYYDIGFSKGKIWPCTRACWPPAWSRRTRSGSSGGRTAPDKGPRITTRVECARILPGPRRRAARPRHPGRPGRLLVPRADGAPAAGLADRGLTSWPARWSTARCPSPISSPGCGRRRTPADSRRGYPGYQPHIGGTPC